METKTKRLTLDTKEGFLETLFFSTSWLNVHLRTHVCIFEQTFHCSPAPHDLCAAKFLSPMFRPHGFSGATSQTEQTERERERERERGD